MWSTPKVASITAYFLLFDFSCYVMHAKWCIRFFCCCWYICIDLISLVQIHFNSYFILFSLILFFFLTFFTQSQLKIAHTQECISFSYWCMQFLVQSICIGKRFEYQFCLKIISHKLDNEKCPFHFLQNFHFCTIFIIDHFFSFLYFVFNFNFNSNSTN